MRIKQFLVATIEFRLILQRQADHAARRCQIGHKKIFDGLDVYSLLDYVPSEE